MDWDGSPSFGQVVIGPPGSGKSTYCQGVQQYMTAMGRKVAVVNLDPANDGLPYDCAIDVASLIALEDVMDTLHLGPNGGLLYCMEFLHKNCDWLIGHLAPLLSAGCYVLFDCPGQVELYTHQSSLKDVFSKLTKLNLRLVAMHLVDSHYCSEPSKFIAVLLTSLTTMLQIELPHINVLSKVDLIEQYGKLAYNLDFFTDVLDLSKLLERFEETSFTRKYKSLNRAITDVVEDYSLVSFATLFVESEDSMQRLMEKADKANGYHYGTEDTRDTVGAKMNCATGADFEFLKNAEVQEKFMTS